MEHSTCTVSNVKDIDLINVIKKYIWKRLKNQTCKFSSIENTLFGPTLENMQSHLLRVSTESIVFFRENLEAARVYGNLKEDFWNTFPELKRIIMVTVDERVQTFKSIIKKLKQSGYSLTEIKAILPLGSDLHNGFGTYEIVLGVKSIILKLKIGNLDSIYSQTFRALKLPPKTIPRLDFTGIYIQKKVLAQETTNYNELYKDMGRNLFTAYLLGCTDLHEENVIISGNQIKLIDCETMFEYSPVMELKTQSYSLYSSILHTGLLPDSSYSGVILSGFSDVKERRMMRDTFHYKVMEGMLVKESSESTELNSHLNQPINCDLQLLEHAADIINGFEEYYRSFLTNRRIIIQEILNYSKDRKVRILLHDTVDYYNFLANSYHPYLMMNSNIRQQYISNQSGITKAELPELIDGYIPYVTSESKVSEESFSKFSENDLIRQRVIILSVLKFEHEFKKMIDQKNNLCITYKPINRSSVYQRIKKIDSTIDTVSFNGVGGEQVWLDKILEGNQQGSSKYDYQVICAPENIYYGQAGLLLLFSKFERISGVHLHNTEILKKQLLRLLKNDDKKNNQPVGFLNGRAGVVYSLIKSKEIVPGSFVYKLCDEYMNQAIAQNEIDFSGGVAGILKVLSSMWTREKNAALKMIISKGVHFLASRYDPELKGWRFPDIEGYVYGYAHGNIGVLSQLIQASKLIDYNLDGSIVSGILEKYCFDYSSNWPISSMDQKAVVNWCHGSPGILYGLTEMYEFLNDVDQSKVFPIICECLPGIIQAKHRDNCLCHGDFGNLMIYKYITDKFQMGIEGDRTTIDHILSSLLQSESIEVSTISFMCGESGILFFLLDFI